jgi:hypothetical protein
MRGYSRIVAGPGGPHPSTVRSVPAHGSAEASSALETLSALLSRPGSTKPSALITSARNEPCTGIDFADPGMCRSFCPNRGAIDARVTAKVQAPTVVSFARARNLPHSLHFPPKPVVAASASAAAKLPNGGVPDLPMDIETMKRDARIMMAAFSKNGASQFPDPHAAIRAVAKPGFGADRRASAG